MSIKNVLKALSTSGSPALVPTKLRRKGNKYRRRPWGIKKVVEVLKGGAGSGHFAHDGRPPEVGGSAVSGRNISEAREERIKAIAARYKKEKWKIKEKIEALSDSVGIDGWVHGDTGKKEAEVLSKKDQVENLQAYTQAVLKTQGFNPNGTVELYRGLNLDAETVANLKEGDVLKCGYAACFSESKSTAEGFGDNKLEEQGPKPNPKDYYHGAKDWDYKDALDSWKSFDLKGETAGVVITAQVPMHKVLSTYRTDPNYKGYSHEKEWTLVNPGAMKITGLKRKHGITYVTAEFAGMSRK